MSSSYHEWPYRLRRTIAAAKNASSPCAKGSVRSTPRSSSSEARPGGPDSRRSSRSNGARSRNASTTLLVLLRLARAGRVHQAAARPHGVGRARQQLDLLVGETRQIARRAPPANVRIAADRAQAGAGRIDEHAIERSAKGSGPLAGTWTMCTWRAPLRRTVSRSSATRPARTSQATSVPESCMAAAIATVLPPGDAHRSRIRSPGCASTTSGTSCDASSWTRNELVFGGAQRIARRDRETVRRVAGRRRLDVVTREAFLKLFASDPQRVGAKRERGSARC